MEKADLEAKVNLAAELANNGPQEFKAIVFRSVLDSLLGVSQNYNAPNITQPGGPKPPGTPAAAAKLDPGNVADLLKNCKDSADRYLVFIQELETDGKVPTSDGILERFKHFRQGTPKNPNRDLKALIAKAWIEEGDRQGRTLSYRVIRKGLERLAELAKAETTT